MNGTLVSESVATLRLRLRYRWDNSDTEAVHIAQRLGAPIQCRNAFGQTTTIATPEGALTLGYVGIPTGLRTILPFTEQIAAAPDAEVSRSDIRRGSVTTLCSAMSHQADIVIVGGQRCAIDAADLHRPYVDAPFRVHLVRDIPEDEELLLAQVSKRDRAAFRKDLRAQRFDTEVTHDEADLAHFYDTMHLPTMRRRHGEQMLTESLVVACRELLGRGFLFFVRSDGVRVAGALCTYNAARSVVTTRLLGVPGGEEQYYRNGAFKALYHLLSEWCRQQGVRHLDLFSTQAWTSKGIFQWKRRLHPSVVLPPNRYKSQRIRIHLVRDRAVVRDFLVANPLLTVDDPAGHLVATWFCDDTRPSRSDIKVGLQGVATERTVNLDHLMCGID